MRISPSLTAHWHHCLVNPKKNKQNYAFQALFDCLPKQPETWTNEIAFPTGVLLNEGDRYLLKSFNISQPISNNLYCILGNWREGGTGGGGSQRHHLSLNITNNILLAFKFELTGEYSPNKSQHY